MAKESDDDFLARMEAQYAAPKADQFQGLGIMHPDPAKAKATPSDDEFLAQMEAQAPPAPKAAPSMGESAVRGGLQGATSGFGDELAAGIDTVVSKVPGLRSLAQGAHGEGLPPLTNPDATYAERRDAYRANNQAAKDANPKTYIAGEVAGGIAQAAALPVAKAATIPQAMLRVGAQGAVSGAGYSDANDIGGVVKDAAVGTVVGSALGAGGKVISNKIAGAVGRAEEGPLRALTAEAKQLLKQDLWANRDSVKRVLTQDPELKKVLADPGALLKALEERLPAAGQKTKEIYAAADAVGGGIPAHTILGPLNVLKNQLKKESAHGAQVAAVDKLINEFSGGLAQLPGKKVPAQKVREWLTTRLMPGPRAMDKEASQLAQAEATAYAKGKALLHLYVQQHVGDKAAGELLKTNEKIATYSALQRIAEEEVRKTAQGPQAVTAISRALSGHRAEGIGGMIGGMIGGLPGAVIGAGAGAVARKAAPFTDQLLATGPGQALGRAMPPVVSGLTQPSTRLANDD